MTLIDDLQKVCLIFELKWFIEPAEVREVLEKSQELAKGISQLIRLGAAFTARNALLFDKLGIDEHYEIGFAVVSANWIGHSNIQRPEVAIIQERHIICKLSQTEGIRPVLAWLRRREYLPSRAVHFDFERINSTIGNCRLEWYYIRRLVDEEFMPL